MLPSIPINNYDTYLKNMSKGIEEKMFFVGRVDPSEFDTIVDFGCADGALIEALRDLYPDKQFVGYDINQSMIKAARERLPGVDFYSSWDDMIESIVPQRSLLILSSVIHEIYSYGTRKDVIIFWNRTMYSSFQYICIRDMVFGNENGETEGFCRRKILDAGYGKQLHDFEKVWGSIDRLRRLTHFLLKYRFQENWDRELRENYFPITRDELYEIVPEKYRVIEEEHAPLPFLVNKIYEDFGIYIGCVKTHLKVILKMDIGVA